MINSDDEKEVHEVEANLIKSQQIRNKSKLYETSR